MSQPIFPIGISFKDWASQMKVNFPHLYLPNPLEVSQWRFWASQVVLANNVPNYILPTHLTFPEHEDWRKWATYFLTSLKS